MSTTHLAGPEVHYDGRAVQRCAWCGEILINERDAVLAANPPAVADGSTVPPTYPMWKPGSPVTVADGELPRWVDGEDIPDDWCLDEDPT